MSAPRSFAAAATTCYRQRTINPRSEPTSKTLWLPSLRGFPPRQAKLHAASIQTATHIDKGHGRRERRTIRTTTWLNDYLDWPSVGQVFHLRRERTIRGETSIEDVYGITSLTPGQASPKKLLSLVRSHWGIENQLFGVRDWTLGEDASRVRTGDAAQVAAGLRNVTLFQLRRLAKRQKQGIADAIRDLRFHVKKAIKLVKG